MQQTLLEEEESSLRAALDTSRKHAAHLDNIAAFWQACEVNVPNKPVPVPHHLLFKGASKKSVVGKLIFKAVERTEESTSTGSGSQRSNEREDEEMSKRGRKNSNIRRDCANQEEDPELGSLLAAML